MVKVWPVIPTRGRADWIELQVDRLTAQLADGEQIVVVTDGCSESAARIASKAPGRLKAVKLADNMGVDVARRLGTALVPAGCVVLEIDDHDLIAPGGLALVREAFADARVVLAYSDVLHTDIAGRVTKLRQKADGSFLRTPGLTRGPKAYWKWAYDLVGGYPTEFYPANDYALCVLLEALGGEGGVAHIRTPIATVLEDARGVSAMNKDAQQRQVDKVQAMALEGRFAPGYRIVEVKGASQAELAVVVAPPEAPVVAIDAPALEPEAPLTKRPIPRILHFIWLGGELPDWAAYNIGRFKALNPGYICLVHKGASAEALLLPEFEAGYKRIVGEYELARKSDLLRVSILAKLGGWYFDCDFLPLRSIDEIYQAYGGLDRHGAFLTQGTPTLVANGIIGASINSEFLRVVRAEFKWLCASEPELHWGAFGPQLYTQLAVQHGAKLDAIGRQVDFYPFQNWDKAKEKWRQITDVNCSEEIIQCVFGPKPPFMLHMSMAGARDLSALEPQAVEL